MYETNTKYIILEYKRRLQLIFIYSFLKSFESNYIQNVYLIISANSICYAIAAHSEIIINHNTTTCFTKANTV